MEDSQHEKNDRSEEEEDDQPVDQHAQTLFTDKVEYSATDNTKSVSPGEKGRRVILLPKCLLPNQQEEHPVHTLFDFENNNNNNNPNDGRVSVNAANESNQQHTIHNKMGNKAPFSVLRIPHPRHGRPSLFLCPHRPSPSAASLYELVGQSPFGGFHQSWFVNQHVIPSTHHHKETKKSTENELLMATRFNPLFLVIREFCEQYETIFRNDSYVSGDQLFEESGRKENDTHHHTVIESNSEEDEEEDVLAAYRKQNPLRSNNNTNNNHNVPKNEYQQNNIWNSLLAVCPSFRHCLTEMRRHALLVRICDTKVVNGETYYKFSKEKTVQHLSERIHNLKQNENLKRILQMNHNNTDTSEVPLAMCFQCVAEYTPNALQEDLRRACGLDNNNDKDTASKRPREEEGRSDIVTPNNSSTTAPSRGPVSASVRRLEKSGKPKGTPTLFSMFAKKQPPPS
ncbi:ribonuclease H2 subunit B [Angomonas deanei]|uniref:Ydr279p protein family (RNase H2 complex component) wHTH domain containing protein, putative n=1 Tax=Angomonas deanei TaxID=59799 RepID=A0A7G2CJV1_9TRYP|nr:ribonuclease H2 subunit B [Angomonas deanei]CAD2219211.1 Ydr279p protein family (RNase H2 complex component) wHTH domain containing protein, putative [Angomonas deanei]|eukprot:EPY33931.1 ribonuclease H2 subunit B [Angomonas deanei]